MITVQFAKDQVRPKYGRTASGTPGFPGKPEYRSAYAVSGQMFDHENIYFHINDDTSDQGLDSLPPSSLVQH